MGERTHALSQKINSWVSNMVSSSPGNPHSDFHTVLPGAWGSSEDTSSASQTDFRAAVGQKHLLALLLNEWADVRPLIWELSGSSLPCWQLQAGAVRHQGCAARSPSSCASCLRAGKFSSVPRWPRGPLASRRLPVDNTQQQKLHRTYSSSHWLENTKFFCTITYCNHGRVHVNQDLELFSFLPATRMHPTQLWYTLQQH